MTSNKQDWGTPKPFVKYVENMLGHSFDFDLAANSKNKVCKEFIGVRENYLKITFDTRGLCWLNPPYDQTEEFIHKTIENGLPTVVLVPSRTDTDWFSKAFDAANYVRFIKGRIKFVGSDAGAPFPSVLFFFDGYTNNTISSKYWEYFAKHWNRLRVGIWTPSPKERGF